MVLASIDVSANEGVKIVGGGKGVGEALVDLKMPNSSGLAEKTRTSFSDALTTDLSSGYGRAMTKQTRTQLKKSKKLLDQIPQRLLLYQLTHMQILQQVATSVKTSIILLIS